MNFSGHALDQNILLKTSVPGPKSVELRNREDSLLANGLQGFALMSGIVVDNAYGNIITDIDGNQLLDMIGGIGVNGLGHSHPTFVSAVQQQVAKASVGSFTSQARIDLLQKIDTHKVGTLNRLQLYSSGAAAVESALRLAKNYTKKWEIASFSGGFHGKTHGVLGLMGSKFKDSYGPFAPGCHSLPFPDTTNSNVDSANYLEQIRTQLKKDVTSGLAAIIIEPVQGTAGNIAPPRDFLLGLKDIAKEFEALLIVDEMITGFGRTGHFWGSEISGVIPDIVTIGKQFGGGYPISGVLTTSTISNTKPWGDPSGSSSSYGGNPLAAAAALSALSIIEQENLVANSKEMGNYFLKHLKEFSDKFPFLANARGTGLMLGIDLVNPKTKQLLDKSECTKIFNSFLQKGLLTMSYCPRFRIQPAMIIDQRTSDNMFQIMDDVFKGIKL